MRRHQSASDISWTRDAIIYQIFPDRFARDSHLPKQGSGFVSWGSKPTAHGFMGGTLRGITERLDYLLDLGVNLIYLAPIFCASANHRYNTYDYYRIDPRLGTLADFQTLLSRAHANGIRVLLDGVFNHCGRGFFPFMMSWNVVRLPPSPPGFSLHNFRSMRSGGFVTGVGRNGLSCPFSI